MALRTSHISRNLRMNARFLGLEVEDLFVISFIAIFFLIAGQFAAPKVQVMKIPLNWFLFLVTIVVGVPFLSAFKYGKPCGYLNDFILWYVKPKKRDSLSRDTKFTEPYIKESGEDFDKKKDKEKERVKHGK
jgi:hypothetical protein